MVAVYAGIAVLLLCESRAFGQDVYDRLFRPRIEDARRARGPDVHLHVHGDALEPIKALTEPTLPSHSGLTKHSGRSGDADSKCVQDECEVRVRIDSGPVCGRVRDAENGTRYYSFLGIPYGKQPVGARRFQELEVPDLWEEPLYAYEEGPACPQQDYIYGGIPVQQKGMSEACIYANVHVPSNADLNCKSTAKKGLPIMVMVHGGGFQSGSGNTDLHGPQYMILKNVIVITFNYRLNVFGFLSLNSTKIPGNNGLRDMVTLLNWVQRNARVFGGNPDDVTLMGQSAGSACVHLLTLSEATEGLFKRVIMMSGTGIPNFFSASPVYAKYVADMFLEALGVNSTDHDYIHQQLIEMSIDKIMNANSIVQFETGLTSFVPVVESESSNFTMIIDAEPLTLIGQGRGKELPMFIGTTDNELEFFRTILMYLDILTRIENNPQIILSPRMAFSLPSDEVQELAEQVIGRYFNGTLTMDDFIRCFTDTYFQYPTLKLAEWRAATGGAPVYLYKYSYESEFSVIKRALWAQYEGAAHVEDLTFIFRTNTLLGDHVSFPPQNRDDNMKDWMTTFVANFMRCSNPTCSDDDNSYWPAVTKDNIQYQTISEPKVYGMSQLTDEQRSMVQFFDSIDREIRSLNELLQSCSATESCIFTTFCE